MPSKVAHTEVDTNQSLSDVLVKTNTLIVFSYILIVKIPD